MTATLRVLARTPPLTAGADGAPPLPSPPSLVLLSATAPPPGVYALYDDLLLLSAGRAAYAGAAGAAALATLGEAGVACPPGWSAPDFFAAALALRGSWGGAGCGGGGGGGGGDADALPGVRGGGIGGGHPSRAAARLLHLAEAAEAAGLPPLGEPTPGEAAAAADEWGDLADADADGGGGGGGPSSASGLSLPPSPPPSTATLPTGGSGGPAGVAAAPGHGGPALPPPHPPRMSAFTPWRVHAVAVVRGRLLRQPAAAASTVAAAVAAGAAVGLAFWPGPDGAPPSPASVDALLFTASWVAAAAGAAAGLAATRADLAAATAAAAVAATATLSAPPTRGRRYAAGAHLGAAAAMRLAATAVTAAAAAVPAVAVGLGAARPGGGCLVAAAGLVAAAAAAADAVAAAVVAAAPPGTRRGGSDGGVATVVVAAVVGAAGLAVGGYPLPVAQVPVWLRWARWVAVPGLALRCLQGVVEGAGGEGGGWAAEGGVLASILVGGWLVLVFLGRRVVERRGD